MRISDWSSDVCSSDLLIGRIVLVDLHLLQARDDRFLEMLRLDRLLGDLAQRDHRIFIAIAIERQIGAARDLPRTLRGEQHEIEPVGDFVDAIFDRDARHGRFPRSAYSWKSKRAI